MADTTNQTDQTPPPAKRFRVLPWWLGLVIVVFGAPGGYLVMTTQPDPLAVDVTGVRIANNVTLSNPSATAQEFMEKLKSLGSNPSFYLEVVVAGQDDPVKTAVREDTPIGNGLTFELPAPLAFAVLREVRVKDDGFWSDKTIDRVDIQSLEESGQIFTFTLITPQVAQAMPRARLIGWILLIAAGAGALVVVLRFVALQVV